MYDHTKIDRVRLALLYKWCLPLYFPVYNKLLSDGDLIIRLSNCVVISRLMQSFNNAHNYTKMLE